jgi:hypothetical protein
MAAVAADGEEEVAAGEDSNRLSEIPQKSQNQGWISLLCGKIPTATFLPYRNENRML